jgi:hypothetical protein
MHQPFLKNKWYLGWTNQNGSTLKTKRKINLDYPKLVYLVNRFWFVHSSAT